MNATSKFPDLGSSVVFTLLESNALRLLETFWNKCLEFQGIFQLFKVPTFLWLKPKNRVDYLTHCYHSNVLKFNRYIAAF